jgi:dTDP-4-dehydrorhamnose reductase
MRLLLTGANGQLGWELRRSLARFGELAAMHRPDCDLAKPEQLSNVVSSTKPDIIVNAAAYTAVDLAETEVALAFTVNSTSVGVLAEEARKIGALIIHYSTDYVFDGRKDAPYTEDDTPNPINVYGHSKFAGEIAVHEATDAYIILRTSWVYASRGRNFLRAILSRARERPELQVVADQIGAPTWAHDIADATADIVQTAVRERATGQFHSGLFNVTASGAVSWHGFAQAILELAKRNGVLCGDSLPHLRAIRSEDYSSPAPRPKNSRLAGDRVKDRFAVSLPDWKLALTHCLAELD